MHVVRLQPKRQPDLSCPHAGKVLLYHSRFFAYKSAWMMRSLQFWQHPPRLKYSVVMPRTVKSDHRFHEHTHDFFELGFVIDGHCAWRVGKGSHTLHAGDALMVPPGVAHYEKIPAEACARLAWVGFAFETSPRMPATLRSPVRAGSHSSELHALLQLIFSEHQANALGSAERARLALGELLIVLCRALEHPSSQALDDTPAHVGPRQAQVARSAARYLTENLTRPLSIRDLARYHSLGTPHFSAVFRRYHGVSPLRFLQQARIARAKEMISEGALSTKEIAAICGFVDAAHFCRRFKETTGVTPKQYRRTQPA